MVMAFSADPKNQLNPEDFNWFASSRRRVNDTFNLGQAQNQYQQSILGNQFARGLGDTTRQFARMREKMPWAAARRGLMNSGIWTKQLADFGVDKNAAVANLTGQFNDQKFGLQLAGQQLGQVRQSALLDLDDQEAARRAAIAAALRNDYR